MKTEYDSKKTGLQAYRHSAGWLSLMVIWTLLLAVVSAAAEKKTAPEDLPLIPSEYVWFFGYIPEGAWVSHHFTLQNPHPDTVIITSLVPGCDCTHVPKPPIVIPPGENRLLKVLFDTRTYFGETNRDVHIVTNYAPHPEMDLYFGSIAAGTPGSVAIDPPSTVFIVGKDSQTFTIRNLTGETTQFRLFVDNDSSLTISEDRFSLPGKGEKTITARPVWEKFPTGPSYSSLVMEVIRTKPFRVTIPIKINKF
jgi:hypothetical protein